MYATSNERIDGDHHVLTELKQSAERLQVVVDTIPAFVWRAAPDGAKEYLNQRWHEYTGISPAEAHGWGWKVVVHPDDLDRLIEEWQIILVSRRSGEMEVRIRRFDGQYRWFLVRAVPKFDDDGNIVNWFGSNTDIEDRKRAEEKVRQNELELRRTIDAIPHGIVILLPEGKRLFANRTMLEYTGMSPDQVDEDGFYARKIHTDDLDRVLNFRKVILEGNEPGEIEQRVLRNDGQYRWFLIRYSPLLNEEGRVARWYCSGTDIHERKLTEDRLRTENVALREELDRSSMFEEIVGSSESLHKLLSLLGKVAKTDSTVLIFGETGTGKELIARAIHRQSRRSKRAFIRVNCAAIPQSLIASELFGHEKGAFTGALQRRVGRFELADGGTLFLDEVGDLPVETQISLLRVLQEREIERVGGCDPISVDVRVLAATNQDLSAAVAAGTFRQDLFYRLNVFPIQVPPLRERVADIALLVEYFIERYSMRVGRKFTHLAKGTLELFKSYAWPGNIRELQNVVERAVTLSEGDIFSVDESWLRGEARALPIPTGPLAALAVREQEMIEAALAKCQGRVSGPSGAAALLKVPRQTLESKIASFGINKLRYRA
jgi:formate hydrogenlyase transcriptional activator